VETTLKVEEVYFMVSFEDGLDLSIGEMVHRSEAYPPTVGQKEWYLIDEK
jgi:hypothetical protein